MRLRRVVSVVIAALTAAGCMHASAPNGASLNQATSITDLDSLAYARPAAQLATADAQSRPPSRAVAQADAMNAQPHVMPVAMKPLAAPAYALDTGDKLRIVVFGQEGLSNSYLIDAAGQITVPLIGAVGARGLTTQQLARAVATKLRAGFIREPHVAIEVETYRPFFILGEVTLPGQYPYVPNMTVETAVAIAGGFTPRAYRHEAKIDRPVPGGVLRSREAVPLLSQVQPGDTVVIKERWF